LQKGLSKKRQLKKSKTVKLRQLKKSKTVKEI
jgi:hypothetical protein